MGEKILEKILQKRITDSSFRYSFSIHDTMKPLKNYNEITEGFTEG